MSPRQRVTYCCAVLAAVSLLPCFVHADEIDAATPTTLTLSQRLSAMPPAQRADTDIALELPSGVSSAVCAAADKIAAAWNAGQYAEAIAALSALEVGGIQPAVGISWRVPAPYGSGLTALNGDPEISPRTHIETTEMDFNKANGDLFALLVDHSAGWSLNRSTDSGRTWQETYFWSTSVDLIDADLSVVDQYVYVGYTFPTEDNEARLRRFLLPQGSSDGAYFYHVVADVSPNEITDVAVESNADAWDNRIYYAYLTTAGAINFHYDVASGGETFTMIDPLITDAARGLDMHWNNDFTTYHVFLSYISTGDAIMVSRLSDDTSPPWNTQSVASVIPTSADRTSIAAREDTAVVVFEDDYSQGTGIAYRVSYNGGDSYLAGTIDYPTGAVGTGNCGSPEITSRTGDGFGVAYNVEVGEPDRVMLGFRPGYSTGVWQHDQLNTSDVSTGSWTSIVAIPDATLGAGRRLHGAAFLPASHAAHFTNLATLCGDANCDGVVDTYDIDAFIEALLGQRNWSTYITDNGIEPCDFIAANDTNGDGVVDTYDIDAFIYALSSGGCP